jgi:hypothetical protein
VPCLDDDKTPNQTPTKRNPYAHDTRDDEQEYGGIPIPMSDGSSDDFMFDDDMSEPSDENKSDTFINCMNRIILPPHQDDKNIDHIATVDMAFTLGPVDGIIHHHQLSPIPIHSNPYSPLQNLNDEIIYRQCMQTFLTSTCVSSPTRTLPNERKKQQNKN